MGEGITHDQNEQNRNVSVVYIGGQTSPGRLDSDLTKWRARNDIEGIIIERDLSIEEAELIRLIPNVNFIKIGRPLEEIFLRPKILETIAKCPSLDEMSLHLNDLSAGSVREISSTQNILYLQISVPSSCLDDQVGDELAALHHLRGLAIYNDSCFSNAIIKNLSGNKNLQSLVIGSRNFDEDTLTILGKMNLSKLGVTMRNTVNLTLKGLVNSSIEELYFEEYPSDQRRDLKVNLGPEAVESLMSMKKLRVIPNIERVRVMGLTGVEAKENLVNRLESLSK